MLKSTLSLRQSDEDAAANFSDTLSAEHGMRTLRIDEDHDDPERVK